MDRCPPINTVSRCRHSLRLHGALRRVALALVKGGALAVIASTLVACDEAKRKPHLPSALAAAWNHYRFGDFSAAIGGFENVLAHTKEGSEENLQALYGLGTTWDLRRPNEDRALAESYYRKAVETGPNSDAAAWSLLAIARMKDLPAVGEESDPEVVRAAYQQVIDRFPGHPAAEEAFLYQQSSRLATLQKADAQAALSNLEQYLKDHSRTKHASAIYELLSEGCDTLDMAGEQVAYAIRALETREPDPTNPRRDNAGAYWRIATLAEFRAGDFETARRYYQRLIAEYPTDQRAFPAEQALARMEEMERMLRDAPEVSPAS